MKMSEDIPDTTDSSQSPTPAAAPAPDRKPHRNSSWWIWLLLIALLGGALYYYLQRQKAEQAGTSLQTREPGRTEQTGQTGRSSGALSGLPTPAVPVVMATAKKGDIGVYLSALGTVTPVYTVNVQTRVDGQLMSVNYREGQMVRKGDLLAEIDPRPFEALLTQAEGQFARDKASLENAHIDLQRYQIALAKNAIPKQTLDTQVALVHQLEGTVKFDQGQIDNAKTQLGYTRITSPISGRVGLRLVDPGNIVRASDTNSLLVITQLQPIDIIFSVAQDFLPQIQQQMRRGRRLIVDALDRSQQKKIATGTLLTIDNQIDPTTGTVRLKAIFSNKDNSLFPNQFVNARLLIQTKRGATLVPTAAIQRNAQGAFVYVVKPDQTVAMQSVSVETTSNDVAAVEGVNAGDLVAVDGFDKLQDGVKVVERKPTPNQQQNQQPNQQYDANRRSGQ
jgi:membrane fusion protein, multidrug efflux system